VPAPIITFLSDYGYGDEFVGICHGVIARRCPEARVIDITHGIPRHDVQLGAMTLASALTYMPAGIHLAVVDPEVGAVGDQARRAVALRTAHEDRLLVGPDNGLLALCGERLGGVLEAIDIGRSPERLQPVSATFHGRDIFAPVAAALAAGAPLADMGEPLEVEELRGLRLSQAEVRDQRLHTHVLGGDYFGNLTLDATREELAEVGLRLGHELELEIRGQRHLARYASTFADIQPGELVIYEDSQNMVAVAVNRGSAAEVLQAQREDELVIWKT
jgi:S-adenosyl-L-methionine hydrolase (adenosine-forming)